MDKNLIRNNNKLLRKQLDIKKASDAILSKIYSLKEFLAAKNVLIFYPLKYEINLLPLLDYKEKNFFLPKVDGDNLLICPYSNNLKKSSFNVMEPDDGKICSDLSIIDLAFIPALAVDKNMNRIGYGKGYYDRLFSNSNFRAKKVVVINKELVVPLIETESFDKKIDFYITD